MKEDILERDHAELFAAARMAYETNTDLLIVDHRPALSKEDHTKIASEVDPIFARAVKEYLPKILLHCEDVGDVVSTLSGLILIGEIKEIPLESVPFLGRGVFVAPFLVEEEPEKVRELLKSVNNKGYPEGRIRDYFFKRRNWFGEHVMCAGILSGTALLEVLYDNLAKTRQIVNNSITSDFFTRSQHA